MFGLNFTKDLRYQDCNLYIIQSGIMGWEPGNGWWIQEKLFSVLDVDNDERVESKTFGPHTMKDSSDILKMNKYLHKCVFVVGVTNAYSVTFQTITKCYILFCFL